MVTHTLFSLCAPHFYSCSDSCLHCHGDIANVTRTFHTISQDDPLYRVLTIAYTWPLLLAAEIEQKQSSVFTWTVAVLLE